ncbi:MAG: pantoate--beta-alanine ligase [Planctomycetota bacterium]
MQAPEIDVPLQVFETVAAARDFVQTRRFGTVSSPDSKPHRVGVVLTMGALHEGHESLIRQSAKECGSTVVSIFLNPTQFAAGEDLSKYPRTLDADLKRCAVSGADAVFVPTPEVIYPAGFSTQVIPPEIAKTLEGQARPEHFGGVCLVVSKLMNILPGDRAYFGKKDYQQWRVIQAMTRDLNLDVDVVACPIIRDPDGLALSSRNVYLSAKDRGRALSIHRALRTAAAEHAGGQRDVGVLETILREELKPVDEIQYAVVRDAETLAEVQTVQRAAVMLIAARVGNTRLIDNQELNEPD